MGGGVANFRQQVQDAGRNPDDVEITLVVMSPVTADLLKSATAGALRRSRRTRTGSTPKRPSAHPKVSARRLWRPAAYRNSLMSLV